MKKTRYSVMGVMLVLLTAGSTAARADSAPGATCITDWSQAADIIRRESLTSVRDLHHRARERQLGDVVRVTLCTDAGAYTYKILVREPKGRVTALTVSATHPFER